MDVGATLLTVFNLYNTTINGDTPSAENLIPWDLLLKDLPNTFLCLCYDTYTIIHVCGDAEIPFCEDTAPVSVSNWKELHYTGVLDRHAGNP